MCVSATLGNGICPGVCRLTKTTAFKKPAFHLPNSYPVSILDWWVVTLPLFSMTGFLSDFSSWRLCVCYCNHCEFMCASVLLCQKKNLFPQSYSPPLNLAVFLSSLAWIEIEGRSGVIYTFLHVVQLRVLATRSFFEKIWVMYWFLDIASMRCIYEYSH